MVSYERSASALEDVRAACHASNSALPSTLHQNRAAIAITLTPARPIQRPRRFLGRVELNVFGAAAVALAEAVASMPSSPLRDASACRTCASVTERVCSV